MRNWSIVPSVAKNLGKMDTIFNSVGYADGALRNVAHIVQITNHWSGLLDLRAFSLSCQKRRGESLKRADG